MPFTGIPVEEKKSGFTGIPVFPDTEKPIAVPPMDRPASGFTGIPVFQEDGQVNPPKKSGFTGIPVFKQVVKYAKYSHPEVDSYINEAAQTTGLSPHLIKAVMLRESPREKNGKLVMGPTAIMGNGGKPSTSAYGYMQLTEGAARDVGVDRFDPQQNVLGGAKYLKKMIDSVGGDEQLGIAAYFKGLDTVKKYGLNIPGTTGGTDVHTYLRDVAKYKQQLQSDAYSAEDVNRLMTAPETTLPQEMGEEKTAEKKTGLLSKTKDVTLKLLSALNIPNAVFWASIKSVVSDEKFKDAYKRYNEEGNVGAELVEKALKAAGVENKVALMVGNILGDIVADPTTYLGFGLISKAGKAAKVIGSIDKAVDIARAATKVDDAAELTKMALKATKIAPKKYDEALAILNKLAPESQKFGVTAAEQAQKGQRYLVGLELPFTGKSIGIKGAPVIGAIEKATEPIRHSLRGVLSIAPKVKDPVARQKLVDAISSINKADKYIGAKLSDRLDAANRTFNNIPKEQWDELIDIAENKDRFAKAVSGEYGELGNAAIEYRNLIDLGAKVRDASPEALTKIDAAELMGRWTHKTPQVGDNFNNLMTAQVRAANNIYRDILKREEGKLSGKLSKLNKDTDKAAEKIGRDYVRSIEIKKVNDNLAKNLADIDNLQKDEIAKIYKNYNEDISAKVSMDIAQARRDDAVDLLQERFLRKKQDILSKHEEELASKLDENLRLIYRRDKMAALEASKENLPLYSPHKIPKELTPAMSKKVKGIGAREYSENVSDELARSFVDSEGLATYTTKQLNEMAGKSVDEMMAMGMPKQTAEKLFKTNKVLRAYEQSKGKPLLGFIKRNPQEAGKLFSTNPGFLVSSANRNTTRVVKNSIFREDVGRGLGVTADAVKADPEKYDGFVKIKSWERQPEGGLYFHPEVAAEIERVNDKIGPKQIKDFLDNVYDPVNSWFKATTLFPFPSYHNRNFVSGVFQNSLAGVRNPNMYKLTAKIQHAEALAKGQLTVAEGLKRLPDNLKDAARKANEVKGLEQLNKIKLPNGMTGAEALKAARQNGVFGKTLFEEELMTGAEKSKNILSTKGPAIRFGANIAGTIEDNLRLTLFFDALSKGKGVDEAADLVKQFHYNYDEITDIERKVLTRLFPFYRFTRFNIPHQLEILAKKPRYFTAVEHGRREVNRKQGIADYNDMIMSEYRAAKIPVQIGSKTFNVRQPNGTWEKRELPATLMLGGWLPTYGAIAQLGHPVDEAMFMLTPALRVGAALATNRDIERRRDFGTRKHVEALLNYPVPEKARYLVRQIRLLNEFDYMLGSVISTVAPEKSNYIVEGGYKPDVIDQLARIGLGLTFSPYDETESIRMKRMDLRKKFIQERTIAKSARRKGDKANMDEAIKRMIMYRNMAAELSGLTQKEDVLNSLEEKQPEK